MKINITPEKKISLYNRDFEETREALDMCIKETMRQLLIKDLEAGTVTLKIDFKINRDEIEDADAPTGTRMALHPEAKAKVSFTLQHKGNVDMDVIPKGSDELLMDSTGGAYLVSREEASEQLTRYNNWDEFKSDIIND